MSLPFGRGGRGLAIQRLLEQQTPGAGDGSAGSDGSEGTSSAEAPRREVSAPVLGRGMPGRGLRIVKAVEEQVQTSSPALGMGSGLGSFGRGGGLSLLSSAAQQQQQPPQQPQPDPSMSATSAASAPSQGLRLNIGRGSFGRGLRPMAPPAAPDPAVSELTERVKTTSLEPADDSRSVASKGDDRQVSASFWHRSASCEQSVSLPLRQQDRPAAAQGQRPEGRRRREPLQPVGPDDKHGRVGQSMKMTANYIRVRCEQEFVHQYCVEFRPPVDARLLRMRIVSSLKPASLGGLSSEARAFDGRILYLPTPLDNPETVIRTKKPNDETDVSWRLKHAELAVELNKDLRNVMR